MKLNTANLDFGKIRFRLIRGLIKEFKPKELYICRTDNWFDSKWLNFSGKTMGAVGVWKNDITIPPFNPNRIAGEGIFDRQTDATGESCTYKLRKDATSIHLNQTSEENLNRKVKHLTNDALFIWASENTELNKFGCIMVYIVHHDEIATFYVSMTNTSEEDESDNWELHKVVGVNVTHIHNYLKNGETYPLRLDVS